MSDDDDQYISGQEQYADEDDDDNDDQLAGGADSQDEDDDEDGSEGDDDAQQRLDLEEKMIKEQLKTASFETIMKIKAKQREIQIQQEQLKSEKKRSNNKAKAAPKDARSSSQQQKQSSQPEAQAKRQKGAPIERNAKQPVSVYQNVISSKKQKGRDPRFDGLSGTFNPTFFNNSYGFIDDMKREEVKILQKDVRKKKFSKEEKQVLKNELGKIKGELKTKEHNDRKQAVVDKYKLQAKESIQRGQLPYFAKKSQIKDDVLKMQFDKLKQTGKLEDMLKRKRKQQSDKLMSAYHLITHKKQKPNN